MTDFLSVDWSTLPVPIDDGASRHLPGMVVPSLELAATDGSVVDLANLSGMTVIYVYPKTGRPGRAIPDGWDMTPGARGCTPQSCAFRDHFRELKNFGVENLFGLSTQSRADQCEAADRLHLPFSLVSDESLALTTALQLPTFEAAGVRLLKRLTLVIVNARIDHVFYPVFPPDQNPREVLEWLNLRLAASKN